jgi:hypothetical protein
MGALDELLTGRLHKQMDHDDIALFFLSRRERAAQELETLRKGLEMLKHGYKMLKLEADSPVTAASILRAIPSEKRSEASRENGKKGGRKRRCHECKDEIKPGDSWERHSYGKGRYVYCSNCAERIRQEQRETDRMEDRRYP